MARLCALVLAAGASSRMGRAKALIPLGDGRTFVRTICDTARAAGAAPLVVVGPPHAPLIVPALDTPHVENARPERGMLSSVQVGLAALPPDCEAALIWPVDTPLVSVATVRALCDHAEPIVIPTYQGRGGHPVRIGREHFAAIAALDGTLRDLFARHSPLRLPCDDPGVLRDFDTPGDLP